MSKKAVMTKPVRLHLDVAELIDKLAPIFGESPPDFASNRLRPILEALRQEGADILVGKRAAPKDSQGQYRRGRKKAAE